MSFDYDVVVIGSGPGGYVAAIKAAQLGFKTACIEMRAGKNGAILGGTCLNEGCIPAKTLLNTTHTYENIQHAPEDRGIKSKGATIDISAMIAHKTSVVGKLNMGVAGLFKLNKVDTIVGKANIVAKHTIEVSNGSDISKITAKNIIMANGSVPVELPFAKYSENIIDSTGAMELKEVPKRLGVIGGGVIGLELGIVWHRLGSKVSVFEGMDTFLASVDRDIANMAYKSFNKAGSFDIITGAKVSSVKDGKSSVSITYTRDGKEMTEEFDKILVAVGRKPNTNGSVDASVGLKIDSRGFVEVDDHCFTGIEGIYAIGDIVRGPMLAHKASEEGVMVVERLHGEPMEINYDAIPSIIYSHPEIASVGKTEQELKSAGVEYKVGSFPFVASGRALAMGATEGMVKILSDKANDRILGVHMFGHEVGELLSQAVIAIECDITSEDLGMIMYPHPTMSEAFREAVMNVNKKAIHIFNKK